MPDATPNYPLKFHPIYKEKVWGGRTLEKLGRALPGDADTLIGESWELADLGQTAPSGGGGGEARSIIAHGPLVGQSLHEVMHDHRNDLLGTLEPNAFGEFPLLVKFLDAQQNLSVQVHPSPAYAATHEDAFLKHEAWYVIDAAPGAVIYKGVKEGVTPEQFRAAIQSDAVEPLLIKVQVKPGDCHYLPSGTCHALGAGVLVAEVQTPSDTTFRVFDWGRPRNAGRELHIEQALACIEFGPAKVTGNEKHSRIEGKHTTLEHLVVCEYFRIDRVTAEAGQSFTIPVDHPTIWMVLAGRASMTPPQGMRVPIALGETIYLPPAMREAVVRFDEQTTWLEVTFPQAEATRIA